MTRAKQLRQRNELALQVFDEVALLFAAARKAGAKEELVTAQGRGAWGLMRLISAGPPRTVPQLARIRGHSRQYIQGLVDDLVADGLVELRDNPDHKRSKHISLTAKGEVALPEMTREAAALAAKAFEECPDKALGVARDVLRYARLRLEEA